jgi:N6-adenosine-specific RNA methylase IME4
VKPFRCIVADPPWPFGDPLPGKSRGAAKNYRMMSIDDICNVQLPPIAKNAYLFMWRVSSMQEEALRVVRAWGFEPKTEIVWRKLTVTGKEWFGMGRTFRGMHETAIVAVRGKPERLNASTRSMFSAMVGAHSVKPAAFYRLVEKLCRGPRLELFARTSRKGWTGIGLEMPEPTLLDRKRAA